MAAVGWIPERRRVVAATVSFYEKAAGDWEPFLALAPHVRGLRCHGPAARRFLIALREMPVHVLGVVDEPTWADGELRTPREFFFHDLDHARYKIREDLLALGYACPDVTPETPVILAHVREAVEKTGPELWRLAPSRLALARSLLTGIDRLPDRALSHAAEWLLFEVVHEKSFPLDRGILRRELEHDGHVAKLERKFAGGFYREATAAVFARLPEARERLLELL